jgi:hypothetical protein
MEENREKQTRLREILAQLTKNQVRLVVALQEYPTTDEAAKAIRLSPKTVYNWKPEIRQLIEEAAQIMSANVLEAAIEIRRHNLVKAMAVKAAGLDSSNEVVRQKAASEIIEWELGKPNQPITGKDGEPLIPKETDDVRHEILRKLDSIAAATGAGAVPNQSDDR